MNFSPSNECEELRFIAKSDMDTLKISPSAKKLIELLQDAWISNTSVVEYFGMIQVTRKDNKEGLENLIRRFNRKVASAGIITTMKNGEFFTKPISKVERRKKAIIRKARKSEKMKRIRLGQR